MDVWPVLGYLIMDISNILEFIKKAHETTMPESRSSVTSAEVKKFLVDNKVTNFDQFVTEIKAGDSYYQNIALIDRYLPLFKLAFDQRDRIKTPDTLKIDQIDYNNDKLILNPTRLPLPLSPYNGQTINLQTQKALKLVNDATNSKRGGETDIQAIVRGLWENKDPSGKEVFRMEELFGVFQYLNGKDANLKTEFFNAMGTYIEKNYSNSQQVFDSLLGLIQSTDWSGSLKDMKEFAEKLAVNMSDEIFPDRNTGVI